jgi:hypothetical protein
MCVETSDHPVYGWKTALMTSWLLSFVKAGVAAVMRSLKRKIVLRTAGRLGSQTVDEGKRGVEVQEVW